MDERDENIKPVMSDAEQHGLAKKKAINKAASYFSDDDSLFEFESFEIEEINKNIESFNQSVIASDADDLADSSAETRGDSEREPRTSDTDGDKGPESFEERADTENGTESNSFEERAFINSESNGFKENADTESETESNGFKENADTESETESNGFKESADTEGDTESDTYEENTDTESETESNGLEESADTEGDAESDVYEENADTDNDTEWDNFEISTEEKSKEGDLDLFDVDGEKILRRSNENNADAFDIGRYGKPVPLARPELPSIKKRPSRYGDDVLAYSFEHHSVNAEGQIHFDGTEPDFLIEIGKDDVSTVALSEERRDDLCDEADMNNEIWDRAGKEEWEARDEFIDECRNLTLPPINTSAQRSPEPESVKTKLNSSGYRYAESERIPVFSDGMNGGTSKAGYAERERRYCEQRRIKREMFLREKARSLQRSVFYTALILLTVFLLEILNSAISGQAILFGSIEIGLIILCTVFVWGGLCDGIKCAARGTFIPELLTFLTVFLSLVYTAVTVISLSANDGAVLVGLPAIAAMFLTAVYRSLMAKREKKVFDITADYGYYCTEVRLSSFRGSPEEIAFGEYASVNSTLYKTNKILRVDRGYDIQPVRDECAGFIKILVICMVCAAVACGIAFGFIKRDVHFGLFCAYTLICFTSPISLFLSLSLPRHVTAENVSEDGAAITDFDEESDEFDENVIMLSEEEIFPAENIRIVDTYWTNSHFLEAHLSKAAAAFDKAGGLLSGLFSGIDLSPANYREVIITDISDGGITVKVDDSLVRAGTDAYLEKHGIEIERYPDIPGKDTRVLYIANNGEFFSRIVIRFIPDGELCEKISELRQADTLFSLKTCNPCIDSSLVFYTTGLEPELLRPVKYMVGDTVSGTDTDREGVLISRTGAVGLLSALLGYKKQKKLVLFGGRLAAISGLIGLSLALTVSLIGIKWKFISFAILGFHLVIASVGTLIGLSGKKPSRRRIK